MLRSVASGVAIAPHEEVVPVGHPNGVLGRADVAVPDMDQGKGFYSGMFGEM